ncbi:IcmT/TraK family protein [Pseudovibrio ascidiaceicola]|uniref:IcmT/TraK family protein n=1 Tax=Pseudovibrio ascidiaceicola TaxID=285279 RepID=UPI003D3608F3
MAHWYNTYKPVKFFNVDVRFGIIFVVSLLHLRLYTVGFVVLAYIVGVLIENRGLGFAGALRAVRSYLAGPQRPPKLVNKKRSKIDYQRVRLPGDREDENRVIALQPFEKQ